MTLRRIVFAFLLVATSLAARAAQGEPDELLVRQAVERYLHGLKFNDVADFKAVFERDAKLYFVKKDGSAGQLTQEQWYKGFEGSAGKQEEGALAIVAIDITGNAAAVKVREDYPNAIYTDYLTLLKLPAGWRIVNKVYFGERRVKP
ncbi:MAG: nuclear transport factor 2 family protein [Pseudomonadota bacterium]